MLNIKITDGNPSTGMLEFEVNGKRGNGNGDAKRDWEVHWMVNPGTPVLSITDIKMKPGSGTDILSEDPPAPQGSQGTHWKAKVNGDAPIVDYYYNIEWESDSGINTHDPKISVKP
jgi:hypothetical protein